MACRSTVNVHILENQGTKKPLCYQLGSFTFFFALKGSNVKKYQCWEKTSVIYVRYDLHSRRISGYLCG